MQSLTSSKFRKILFLIAFCFLSACKTALHTGLPEPDANEIISKLVGNGIYASKKVDKGGNTVLVDWQDFGAAVDILQAHGLPRRKFNSVNDVFNSEGLVASPLQEWARLNYAMSQELSNSISRIPGVIRADVHLGQTYKESPFEEVDPPSASVLIQIDKNMLTENLVPEVKQLIALAHPDIEFERVGVVVTPVSLPTKDIPFSEIGGIVVRSEDAQMMRWMLFSLVGLTVLSIGLIVISLIFWRRRKVD